MENSIQQEDTPKWIMSIMNKLDNIEKRLDSIETELKTIQKSSKQMESHIEFVETVYDNIKTPFNFIMNKVAPIAYITASSEEDRYIEY
jgi:archaellum component FlaC